MKQDSQAPVPCRDQGLSMHACIMIPLLPPLYALGCRFLVSRPVILYSISRYCLETNGQSLTPFELVVAISEPLDDPYYCYIITTTIIYSDVHWLPEIKTPDTPKTQAHHADAKCLDFSNSRVSCSRPRRSWRRHTPHVIQQTRPSVPLIWPWALRIPGTGTRPQRQARVFGTRPREQSTGRQRAPNSLYVRTGRDSYTANSLANMRCLTLD